MIFVFIRIIYIYIIYFKCYSFQKTNQLNFINFIIKFKILNI